MSQQTVDVEIHDEQNRMTYELRVGFEPEERKVSWIILSFIVVQHATLPETIRSWCSRMMYGDKWVTWILDTYREEITELCEIQLGLDERLRVAACEYAYGAA